MSYNPYSYAAGDVDVTEPQARYAQRQAPASQSFGPQGVPAGGQPLPQSNAGFGLPDPRANMAIQLGQTAFSSFLGQDNFQQFQDTMNRAGINSNSLSFYFQVSTSYVIRKLKLIMVPFTHRSWQRIPDGQGSSAFGSVPNSINGAAGGLAQSPNEVQGAVSGTGFLPPRDDINCPDMYIPVMGLVTYILLWNLQQGLRGSFNPENLYYKLSSTLAFVALDLVVLKLGLYLLVHSSNSPTTGITELTCFVGYKFVPLIATLLAPSQPAYVALLLKLYLFLAFGVFLLRSVKFNLFSTPQDDVTNFNKQTVKKCNYFLFVYGFLWQGIVIWLMG